MDRIKSALVGKAGEALVAAELMRCGVEVAIPASDVGVDLLAYRLHGRLKTAGVFVPVQVKAYSGTGYRFLKNWFHQAPGLALVSVWHVVTSPEFYVFRNLADVEAALGDSAGQDSWVKDGVWSVTKPSPANLDRMSHHRGQWARITGQL